MRKNLKSVDLNKIYPEFDGIPRFGRVNSLITGVDSVEMHFDHLAERLGERIREASFVCGCMAWLTSRSVLSALSELEHGCQIVVQKEDFLRPGIVGREELQRMYRALRCPNRHGLPGSASHLSYCGDPSCQSIRCMGVAQQHANQTVPRMHHKFFVFCREKHGPYVDGDDAYIPWPVLAPYAIWTGSFNATENAARSRENALFIESEAVAQRYLDEWVNVLALSEPLDWSSDYVEPEWRFGS